jgi:hypothetical protein
LKLEAAMSTDVSNKQTIEFDPSSWFIFVQEFSAETDRAAVILGAAKLDLLLFQILQKFLVPSPGSNDELLDGDSPLSTFSGKIHIAYRLGIVNGAFARALHMIRRIRNTFAHEATGCNLESGAHRDRVKELCSVYKNYPQFDKIKGYIKECCKDSIGETSLEFRVVLAILAAQLEKAFARVLPVDDTKAIEPINPAWSRKPVEADQEPA